MKITFHGAAKTVTGSCFLVETKMCNFLVDCGLFQGHSKEDELNREDFPFNPGNIDFVLLTHAHIDHSGRIPKLFINGFKGEVITTQATAQLCSIMLPDSGHIQEIENEWLNRKRLRAGKPLVPPIYTHDDAVECMSLFRSVDYNTDVNPVPGITVRFRDAGHVLGSSCIEIWVEEDGKEVKLVFTGDLGNKEVPILKDPEIIDDADYLIIESTYGNRVHKDNADRIERFMNIIIDTINGGGNVIIPSFAVGRTQEIIYELNKHKSRYSHKLEELMRIPVYVDSPLAISATEIFRKNLDCYNEEAREYIKNGDNPLDFPELQFTKTANESRALNEKNESMIIISASGMCEAGRIKHHLKHNLWRPESTILFVGYQAEGTLGRRIVDGAKKVKIFGEQISVNARIEYIDGFSGHADKDGLLDWVSSIKKKPKNIFVVHGEEDSVEVFAEYLRQRLGINTVIPSQGDSFKIKANRLVEQGSRPEIRYSYARLGIIDQIETLKEQFEELSEALKADLKRGKRDSEVEEVSKKLRELERSLVEILK